MRARVIAVSLVAGMIATTAALAQGDHKPPPTQAHPAPPPPVVDAAPPAPPPYEPQLMRLAEVLGALHHLRTVCGAPDADVWRDRLAALIEAEAPSPDRRDRLAGAFNASFRTWARSYRSCTPSAKLAIERFLGEAGKIAEDVRVRYGP
jgi:uncharacterized protein (TIGR02301 family)